MFFFFFQAEDGIRDGHVTGVQTCALPISDSMQSAIDETNRRRQKQLAFNAEHGIDPTPLRKRIADVTDMLAREDINTETQMATDYRSGKRSEEHTSELQSRGHLVCLRLLE